MNTLKTTTTQTTRIRLQSDGKNRNKVEVMTYYDEINKFGIDWVYCSPNLIDCQIEYEQAVFQLN